MKNIHFAIAFAAFAFSACTFIDDDDDDKKSNPKSGACYLAGIDKYGQPFQMCVNADYAITLSECKDISEYYANGQVSASIKSSCPPKEDLFCSYDDGSLYLYGQIFVGTNCSDFDGSEPTGPSSSSNSGTSGVCYVNDYYDKYCFEAKTGTISSSECDYEGGTIMSSCPAGQKQKCYDDYYEEIYYLYNAGETCESWGMVSLSSSSSNSVSEMCYVSNIPNTGDLAQCLEGITYTITRTECQLAAAQYGGTATFPQNCPAGYELKCLAKESGEEMYVYVYGQIVTLSEMTCEKIGFSDANSSSSSRPSSSSAYYTSSSSNSKTACYVIDDEDYGTTCLEDMTSSECADWAAGQWSMRDSCPDGYKRKCDDYYGSVIYLYSQMWEYYTCDYLF